MGDVRDATLDDLDVVARIAAVGFQDDPIFAWVFPDPESRPSYNLTCFNSLVRDYLPNRGRVQMLEEAAVAFWRDPSFQHSYMPLDQNSTSEWPFPHDSVVRFDILEAAMMEVHPHEPHWYLNVVSTIPERQGQGLGARVLAPVLQVCDVEGVPAYLESSNPRNMTLYRRLGFEQTGEIKLPDGPSLYPMWRTPG